MSVFCVIFLLFDFQCHSKNPQHCIS